MNPENFDKESVNDIPILKNKNFIFKFNTGKSMNQLEEAFIKKYKEYSLNLNFENFFVDEIFNHSVNKISNENFYLVINISSLVKNVLNFLKNGKIKVNEREQYSFEHFYKETGSIILGKHSQI